MAGKRIRYWGLWSRNALLLWWWADGTSAWRQKSQRRVLLNCHTEVSRPVHSIHNPSDDKKMKTQSKLPDVFQETRGLKVSFVLYGPPLFASVWLCPWMWHLACVWQCLWEHALWEPQAGASPKWQGSRGWIMQSRGITSLKKVGFPSISFISRMRIFFSWLLSAEREVSYCRFFHYPTQFYFNFTWTETGRRSFINCLLLCQILCKAYCIH